MRAEPRNFDREAHDWDANPRRVLIAQAVASAILKCIHFTGHERVLDYGCGTGLVSLALAKSVGTMLAVDSSEGMLAQFRRKLDTAKVHNVRMLCADLEQDFRIADRFDLIICTQTLSHIQNEKRVLRHLAGLLAPGGALVISEMESSGSPGGGFSRHELAGSLSGIGLGIDGVWECYSDSVTGIIRTYYVLKAVRPRA